MVRNARISAFGATLLAEKESAKREPEPDPVKWSRQPLAIQVRGTPEWKQWVHDLARANRQDVAGVVDTALALQAKQIGFREPPER
jgi:hypothetical protein